MEIKCRFLILKELLVFDEKKKKNHLPKFNPWNGTCSTISLLPSQENTIVVFVAANLCLAISISVLE